MYAVDGVVFFSSWICVAYNTVIESHGQWKHHAARAMAWLCNGDHTSSTNTHTHTHTDTQDKCRAEHARCRYVRHTAT